MSFSVPFFAPFSVSLSAARSVVTGSAVAARSSSGVWSSAESSAVVSAVAVDRVRVAAPSLALVRRSAAGCSSAFEPSSAARSAVFARPSVTAPSVTAPSVVASAVVASAVVASAAVASAAVASAAVASFAVASFAVASCAACGVRGRGVRGRGVRGRGVRRRGVRRVVRHGAVGGVVHRRPARRPCPPVHRRPLPRAVVRRRAVVGRRPGRPWHGDGCRCCCGTRRSGAGDERRIRPGRTARRPHCAPPCPRRTAANRRRTPRTALRLSCHPPCKRLVCRGAPARF